jgi:hypothetical protein
VISRPTNQQVINAVVTELGDKVGPTITDGGVKVIFDMALAILAGSAVRAGNELAWMHEEIEAIEEVARRLVGEMPEAIELAAALQAHDDGKTGSLYIDEAQRDYDRASEVLSCATEAAYRDGDPDRIAAVEVLLKQRMANENSVTGQFLAVGRE